MIGEIEVSSLKGAMDVRWHSESIHIHFERIRITAVARQPSWNGIHSIFNGCQVLINYIRSLQ
jgi:hypothetical protein